VQFLHASGTNWCRAISLACPAMRRDIRETPWCEAQPRVPQELEILKGGFNPGLSEEL